MSWGGDPQRRGEEVYALSNYLPERCLNANDFCCVARENVRNFRIIFGKTTKKREKGEWMVDF